MQCKSCLKESPVGAKFCAFCGETVSAEVNEPEDFTPDYEIESEQRPVVESSSQNKEEPQEDDSDDGICAICGNEDDALIVRWGESCCKSCLSAFGNRRIGAFILDYVSIFITVCVLFFIGGLCIPGFSGMSSTSLDGLSRFAMLVPFLLKDAFQGRSIGKRAMGLAVVDIRTGQSAGVFQSFLRNVPLLVPFVGLFALTSLENESRLGEGWAGTKVVLLGSRVLGSKSGKASAPRSKRFSLLWIGPVLAVIFVVALLAAIAIPNLLRAKISANDALAKGTLRTLSTASETYATTNRGYYPTSIYDLTNARPPFLNASYCDQTISGYTYLCQFSSDGYEFTATPVTVGTSGSTTYAIKTGGVLSQ